MRWLLDIVALVTALGILAGVMVMQRQQGDREEQVDHIRADLRQLVLEIKYRAATGKAELNSRGWPVTVSPAWFDDRPTVPRNTLLDGAARPWVEVASADEAMLQHPPVRMAVSDGMAGFWYNPYQGVVRARVPVMVSDDDAVNLYNRINDCALTSIFQEEKAADPAPEAGPNKPKPDQPADADPTKPRSAKEMAPPAPGAPKQHGTLPTIRRRPK